MKLRNYIIALLALGTTTGEAQIATRLDQYYIQPSIINTAAINAINGTSIDMFVNKIFWNVNGSPQNVLFNIAHHKYGNAAGFGAMFGMEKIGFVNHINGNVSYAYTLPSKSLHKFTFSPSIGFINEKLNASSINVIDGSDPIYQSFLNEPSQTKFDLRLSGLYAYKGLMLGLSSSRLASRNFGYEDKLGNTAYVPIKNLSNAFLSLKMQVSNGLVLQPVLSSTLTDFKSAFTQYGVNAIIAQKMWAGIHNAGNKNLALNIGAIFNQALKVGYSYSMPFSANSKLLGSGHEIVASYLLGAGSTENADFDKFVLNEPKEIDDTYKNTAIVNANDVDKTLNTKNPDVTTTTDPLKNAVDIAKTTNNTTVDSSATANTTDVTGSVADKTKGGASGTDLPTVNANPKLKPGEILVNNYKEAAEQIALGKTNNLVLAALPVENPPAGHYLCVAFAKTEAEINNKVKELWTNGLKAYKLITPSNGYYYAYIDRFDNAQQADAAKWSGKYNVSNLWTKQIK